MPRVLFFTKELKEKEKKKTFPIIFFKNGCFFFNIPELHQIYISCRQLEACGRVTRSGKFYENLFYQLPSWLQFEVNRDNENFDS